MAATDYSQLLRAAFGPKGTEDDMYCARHVPGLISRIRELETEAEKCKRFQRAFRTFARLYGIESSPYGVESTQDEIEPNDD